MNEHIVDLSNVDKKSHSFQELFDEWIPVFEEIVRCRDCRYYDPNEEPSEVYPDRFWCDKLTVYMPPDGFCSFGKRKEGGE